MRGKVLALVCAFALGLCGCAANSAPVDQEPEPEVNESVDNGTLDLDGLDPDDASDSLASLETPVNPSGVTEAGCMMVGMPYFLGPIEFNCPTSFLVMKTTDESIELYDPVVGMVSANVSYNDHNYPSSDKADLVRETLIDSMGASYPEGFELRWFDYDPERIFASFIGTHINDDGTVHKNVGGYIYSADGYTAYLIVTVPEDSFAENKSTAESIVDTLRISE